MRYLMVAVVLLTAVSAFANSNDWEHTSAALERSGLGGFTRSGYDTDTQEVEIVGQEQDMDWGRCQSDLYGD